MTERRIEYLPVAQLKPAARNPKRHDLAELGKSIDRFGYVEPVVLDERTGKLVAGHGRVATVLAKFRADPNGIPEGVRVKDGEWCLPVVRGWKSKDDTEAEAYLLASNQLVMGAGWEDAGLAEMLRELHSKEALDGIGFPDEDLARLLGEVMAPAEGNGDPDEVPEEPKEVWVKQGDLFQLGEHRLICGDSREVGSIDRLMAGDKASLVFTDPPYNIASETTGFVANGNTDNNRQNARLMNSEWDKDFVFSDVGGSLLMAMGDDCAVYVSTSHLVAPQIWAWMKEWADFNGWCVWAKSNPFPSLSKRHWTWCAELICYATRGRHTFNFPVEGHALSVWEMSKIAKSDLHPTMKPVDVPLHAIRHSSNPGDIVLDAFGGAGSTLIACEQSQRACRMLEISPLYTQIIIERWERFTSQKAKRLE